MYEFVYTLALLPSERDQTFRFLWLRITILYL